MRRRLLLSASTLVAADLMLALAGRAFVPGWTHQPPAAYRIHSEIYHHDLAPHVDATAAWGRRRHILHTNSLGFKDATDREVTPVASGPRLLLVGDSFTEGVGFPFGATFAGRIARALEPDGVEVLNAGVVSYSPTIYYRKVRHLVEDVGLTMDEVVVFLDISDIADEAMFYDLDDEERVTFDTESAPEWARNLFAFRSHPPGWKARVQAWLRNHSTIARFVSDQRLRRIRDRVERDPEGQLRLPRINQTRARWTFDLKEWEHYGEAGVAQAKDRMARLRAFLSERGIRMTVVVYPWPDQVLHDKPASLQVRLWRQWCEEEGVRFVDLFPPFFPREGESRPDALRRNYIPGDVHFNAVGHATLADAFLASRR